MSKTPKKLKVADDLRHLTEIGKKKIASENELNLAKEKAADRKLQREMRKRAKELFEEALISAKTAAEKGEESIRVTIMQWSSDPSPRWATLLTTYTSKLLEQKGLSVEVSKFSIKPIGSDPLFYDTVHNIDLIVTW